MPAQLLCGERAGSPEEVARRLLAIQAQDPRGARLAVRARSAGLSASDVDSALARRAMVVTWLNRGTLHLVRAEDYWWVHPLTNPRWAGIGLRDTRLGLARCGAVQRADSLAGLPARVRRPAAALPPRLLGAFDPLLLGWEPCDPITGSHRQIVTVSGLFRPFALVSSRAVATWTIKGSQITLAPFAELDPETRAALETDAADMTRFSTSRTSASYRRSATASRAHRANHRVGTRSAICLPGSSPLSTSGKWNIRRLISPAFRSHHPGRTFAREDGHTSLPCS